jgi:hypothetical protein
MFAWEHGSIFIFHTAILQVKWEGTLETTFGFIAVCLGNE